MDGAYQRYEKLLERGYRTTFFRLNHHRIHVILRRDYEVRESYDAVLGVDVGVKTLAAVSIVNRHGRVLRQLYLGRDVGNRQRDIDLRRSKLRSNADNGGRHARQALRRLRRYEDDYTTTRCWEVAHEIVRLAERCNAFISYRGVEASE